MKLVLRRSHVEKMEGGGMLRAAKPVAKLSVIMKIEFTPEERAIYNRYPYLSRVLIHEYQEKDKKGDPLPTEFIFSGNLVQGHSLEFADPVKMAKIENAIISTTRAYAQIVKHATRFGQDDVIDFDTEEKAA